MNPRHLGMLAGLTICAAFVACDSFTSVEPFPTSATTGPAGPGPGPGPGGMGGMSTSVVGGQGGEGAQGPIGGAGGTGGEECVAPAVDGAITARCGMTSVASSGSGTSNCVDCVQDAGGNDYSVECNGASCACKYNGATQCTCDNDNTQTCSDSCCPSPWNEAPVNGMGGYGGSFSTSTVGGAGGVQTAPQSSVGSTSGSTGAN